MIRSPEGAATTSQFLICISRDLSMEAALLFCCHVVLITRRRCGGKVEGQLMTSQFLICMSRDLSMEAVILFCCHVVLITRRHCGARSKIKDHRPCVPIRLPVRVRVSHTNSDVCSEP